MKKGTALIAQKLLYTLFLLIVTVALSVISNAATLSIETDRGKKALADASMMLIEEVSIRMDKNIDILHIAEESIIKDDCIHSPDDTIFHLDTYVPLTMFSRIDVLYPDNTLLIHPGTLFNAESYFSFDELLAQGEHISHRITDPQTDLPVLYYYLPVADDSQTYAILIGVIDCGHLAELIHTDAFDGGLSCAIVDRYDGSFIMDSMNAQPGSIYSISEPERLKNYRDIDLVDDVVNARTGMVAYASDRPGKDAYVYYSPTGIYDWQLLIVAREDVAFASLISMRNISIISSALGAMLLLIYLAWNIHNIVQLSRSNTNAEEQLHKTTTLVECVTELSSYSDIDIAVNNMLAIVNNYFKGDRTYVFDADYERQTTSNLYEYAIDGVSKEIDNLQDVPLSAISLWLDEFSRSGIFYISDIDRDVNRDTNTYEILAAQNIHSLIAVPLISSDVIIGFMGVDNPRENYNDLSLLSSVQFFITEGLERRKRHDVLTRMSYHDPLTNLFNRNWFDFVCGEYRHNIFCNVGVAYFDLNGLKKVNDTYGHEAGDQLIKSTAECLNQLFPGKVCRIGGDEFVVITHDIAEEDFSQQVEDTRYLMTRNDISVSIGISWRSTGSDIGQQLTEADQLMYAEKIRQKQMLREEELRDKEASDDTDGQ